MKGLLLLPILIIIYHLFPVTTFAGKNVQVPEGYGDYNPHFVDSINKIVWLRGSSITDQNRALWKGNPDGTDAEQWIKNVESIAFYVS